jgi:hypothetical protein
MNRTQPQLPALPLGKFFHIQGERFLIKGVTYGTFGPDAEGYQFPPIGRVAEDFAQMRAHGINTVRVYTVPTVAMLDEAARQGLRVMVGIPWAQHIAFLDDAQLCRTIRRDVRETVRSLAGHPAVLMFALGNEIPAEIVRWHGRERIEAFIRQLYDDGKSVAPDSTFTYVNFPPTEYLDLPFLDVCAFNVYLHDEAKLRSYVARLQHIAGNRPLLLAEAGADSLRHGPDEQARLTAMQLRASFAEGACGAVAFAWTDEWWRGGHPIEDWAFGLVDAERRPKAALHSVSKVFAEAPFSPEEQRHWPKVSVVICAYNAASTLEDCLSSLERMTYPNFEVIVVNDGSKDATGAIARRHPSMTLIEVPNGGLSAARNIGLAQASGEIVAYTDADVRVESDWLTYLVQPFLTSDVVACGGPNVAPADDPWLARALSLSPGGPTHVLLDDRVAEHVPGSTWPCGGCPPGHQQLQPVLRAGDDVDVCWRLQARVARSASRRRRSSGTITARRSRRSGGSRLATGRARRGCGRIIPTSSSGDASRGVDTSTAPCRSCAPSPGRASTRASGARRRSRRCTTPTRIRLVWRHTRRCGWASPRCWPSGERRPGSAATAG